MDKTLTYERFQVPNGIPLDHIGFICASHWIEYREGCRPLNSQRLSIEMPWLGMALDTWIKACDNAPSVDFF